SAAGCVTSRRAFRVRLLQSRSAETLLHRVDLDGPREIDRLRRVETEELRAGVDRAQHDVRALLVAPPGAIHVAVGDRVEARALERPELLRAEVREFLDALESSSHGAMRPAEGQSELRGDRPEALPGCAESE